MRVLAILLVVAACSKPTPEPAKGIELPGDGNGLFWDGTSLYVTDETHDQIATLAEPGSFSVAAALPAAPKLALGGIVRTTDGTFVVASFGFGTDGAIFTIKGTAAAKIPNLDPKRRRLGLAIGADNAIYDAWFVVEDNHQHHGGVARVDLAGHETDLEIPGLVKPVGVAVTATTLYVSDQEQGAVFAYDLASHAVTPFATKLTSADLLTVLPNGDLVTGGKKGEVYRISKRGAVTTIATGYDQVRGTAYDPAKHRLFVVEHGATKHQLHILPLAE